MKLKFVLGLLSSCILVMSILLYIKEEPSVEIITCPMIHSYYKTTETETFEIEVLTNQPNDYHFAKEFISSSNIQSLDESELIPVTITEITSNEEFYRYQNKPYSYIQFSMKIGFDSPNYEIEISDAYLTLHYSNDESVMIYIGEFQYRFLSVQPEDILVGSLQSTVMKHSDISTVSGIAVELSNNASENIIIKSLKIGSQKVAANHFYMTEIQELPDLFSVPETVIGITHFDYLEQKVAYERSYLLREHQTSMLYLPFQYDSSTTWLQRFYIVITYEVSGVIRELVIDDFPYIRTNLFQQGRESEFILYVLPH